MRRIVCVFAYSRIRVFVYSKMDFPARKKTDVDKKPGAML